MDAEKVLDVIGAQMRGAPPPGVSVAYVEGFLARNRVELVAQLRAGLNQMQMVLSQQDHMRTLREDYWLLKVALLQLRSDDAAREQLLAGWLLTQAQNEARAVAGAWLYSSRERERGDDLARLADADRTLGAALRAVRDGARRLDVTLQSELQRYMEERQAEIVHLQPATFPYTPCGITQAHIDEYEAEREQANKARRSHRDTAIEAMSLSGIPGLDVYLIRAPERGVAQYGVRYMGAERGWFSHFDEPGGLLDAYASIDNGIFSGLVNTVLGQSYSYRGLMRYFAPEVYDLIAPTSRAFPASEIPFSFKTKAGVGFCALYYPGPFGVRREVVSQVQIQATPRGNIIIEYIIQGKRKPLSVTINGNERQFVALMSGLEDRLRYQPYASAHGTVLHRMYDTETRKQFLYRLREWLRWEPVQPIWLGYGGLDISEDYYAADWATTPLLRELQMVVEEKAPMLVSEVEPLITGAWDVSQVDRVDAAIQRTIPDSGHELRLDVIRAFMRHLV